MQLKLVTNTRLNSLITIFSIATISNIFSACNIINPQEPVPTYIHIAPFTFYNPDSSYTGSSSHNIPSAWVFANDQAIGTFDLPCTIPIILSKSQKIKIVPAVYSQGMKSYLLQYPFYSYDTVTLENNPSKITNYTPRTRYLQNLKALNYKLLVNFEEGMLFKNIGSDTSMIIETSVDKAIEGGKSGAIYLDATKTFSESISTNYFEPLANNTFIELDYKGTIPFQVGIQAEDLNGGIKGEYLAGLNPNSSKTKIYIEIGSVLKSYQGYSRFYIKIRSTLNDFNGVYKEGYVILDNIKVISN